MAEELACQKHVFACCIVPRSLRNSEIVTLYIKVIFCKKASKKSRLIVRWVRTFAGLEHNLVIIGFNGLLVFNYSIKRVLIEVHISRRAFFGLEMHMSQAICVRFQFF